MQADDAVGRAAPTFSDMVATAGPQLSALHEDNRQRREGAWRERASGARGTVPLFERPSACIRAAACGYTGRPL